KECSVEAGVRLCEKLLKGRRMPSAKLRQKLKRAGFVGHRYYRVLSEAGVRSRRLAGRGEPWMSELTKGRQRVSLVDLLKNSLANGPVLAETMHRKLEKAGYHPHGSAVNNAKEKAGVHHGPETYRGPHLWWLEEKPPSAVREQHKKFLGSLLD